MNKKLIAPLLIVSVWLIVITLIGFNFKTLAQGSEADKAYFTKSIPRSNIVIVEPNYGHFYNPHQDIEGDSSGEILYHSLDEIAEDYDIKRIKMVKFERKGEMIPNLYIYVDSPELENTNSYSATTLNKNQ